MARLVMPLARHGFVGSRRFFPTVALALAGLAASAPCWYFFRLVHLRPPGAGARSWKWNLLLRRSA
ncbi:MAG: hypothetical protein J7M26_06330 [Armatimonadetes bacterium]|nr:hypothetical protein [Armatimonadota bacterium]